MPSPIASPPSGTARRLEAARLDGVFAGLAAEVANGTVPAAALAIGDGDGAIRIEAFSGRSGRRIDESSMFFLASVTKPIFATAFLQLVDAGLLDLHAPLAEHLPPFDTPAKRAVTAWHLLTHTSGVADVPTEQIRRERPTAARMTELASTSDLRFEPGSRWEYCTSSFYILGELITRLTGLPYPRFLQERLCEPLGMRHTTFDPRGRGRPLVPVHGIGADNRLRRFFLLRYLVSIAPPGGGLWGTLDDLLRFGAAVLRPREVDGHEVPLSPAMIERMGEDQTHGLLGRWDDEERRVHFGLGWGKPTLMGTRPGSDRVISHGGATGTRIWVDPEADLVFVYFTNQWAPEPRPQLDALRGTYEALAGR